MARVRTHIGTRLKPSIVGAGAVTVDPNAVARIMPQLVSEMERVGELAEQYAAFLAPVDEGIMRERLDMSVDKKTAIVTLFDSSPFAHLQEWGTGMRGSATRGARGAGDWPNDRDTDYSLDINGHVAQPFLRPGALAAVRRVFGSA